MELMDRSNMKINGVCFGDVSVRFYEDLKNNHVYRISKRAIREENYTNTKNDAISAFKLVFFDSSVFEEISDVNLIAKNEDTAFTLDSVIQRRVISQ